MSKLFSVAGVSKRNGTFKARFANDLARVKVLAKTGSTDIAAEKRRRPSRLNDGVSCHVVH